MPDLYHDSVAENAIRRANIEKHQIKNFTSVIFE